MNEEQFTKLCRATAQLAMQQIVMVPGPVRLEAAMMVVKSVFMDVVPAKRLELFNEYMEKARDDLVNDLNKNHRVPDGKDGNERTNRSKAARKKGRRGSRSA